ncbi:MAG: UDP-N-acetylmuramoyl-L-alanyl-D-glutamate--2,6-diaminopimelate ligase, partial [Candidatus Krumholzibacteria bacterium]|nr:UDP-N-acetylmuramoyl-L-alanyl-D-glutamate--2,6-diaminopimelate ligase [Candidatus Krumholzibacteria bacterium]
MRLSRLVEPLQGAARIGWRDVEIQGLATDSREVRGGDLFIALRGARADGHEHVGQALRAGAAALVVEKPVEADVPVVVVDSSSTTEALLARIFYGDPSSRLVLVGITGTNGKTSTAFMLRSILERSHGPAGIIGTVGFGAGDQWRRATHTTPTAAELNRILAGFVERGCRSAVMEVSSHAASQGRIAGLEFDAGVFTNISRDHMDYHGTVEAYTEAKEIFVRSLAAPGRRKPPGTLAYNIDDPRVAEVAGRYAGPAVAFGASEGADVRCAALAADLAGTRMTIEGPGWSVPVRMAVLGRFSAWNALGAAASAAAVGAPPALIGEGLEAVSAIPGRFQLIPARSGPTVIVDYAHTPDALEKLLSFCRELVRGRLITVFGAGGDRDRGKRPMMGRVAVERSDLVFVTSDNPRSEDPDAIVRDIVEGTAGSGTPLEIVVDRAEAIRLAITAAGPEDLVVIAGKGHEDYQILAGGTVPFSDAVEARRALAALEVYDQG